MKNIFKFLNLLIIALTIFNCDEENNFEESNINLVPVYAITNIQGQNNLHSINVYREKDLIIEFYSQVNANNFISSNYVDTSTETNFNFSTSKVIEGETTTYSIIGDKETNSGTLTITNNTVSTHNISITEKDVYN